MCALGIPIKLHTVLEKYFMFESALKLYSKPRERNCQTPEMPANLTLRIIQVGKALHQLILLAVNSRSLHEALQRPSYSPIKIIHIQENFSDHIDPTFLCWPANSLPSFYQF